MHAPALDPMAELCFVVVATSPVSRSRRRTRSSSNRPSTPPVGAQTPFAARSRGTLVALLAIAVATVLAYSNTFDASFHFDDVENIVQNENLRDLSRMWPPSGSRWFGFITFALNYGFGGLQVFGYHLVNLLIHVCSGLLVFWLAETTLRTPALRHAEAGPLVRGYLPLAAGLLFALHPVQTQAVTYIVQRFASLATLLFLLSLVLYAQARLSLEANRPSRRRATVLYSLSLVAAVLAMKTKENSVTLPFVAAGYEWLFFRPRSRLLLVVPLTATALLVPLGLATQGPNLTDVLAGAASRSAPGTPDISRSVYLLTQSRVVATYLRLLLLPIGQNLDYDFRLSQSLADPSVLFALAILVAVATTAVLLLRWARKKNRAPGVLIFFGIAWFFVTLSVESSVIPIRDVIFEHRMYLPSAGAAIALAAALLWAVEHLRLHASVTLQAGAALLVTAGPLGVATYARNFVWKDDLTLWRDVVAKSPQKALSHTRLADLYREHGQLNDAIREYREAIRLTPELVTAHNNLGSTYEAKRLLDDAAREYGEAIRLAPDLPVAHINLGNIYFAKGQLDDAVREHREAIRLDPRQAAAHNNLGNIYFAKGQRGDAASEYREATRLAPGMAGAHGNLGNTLREMGRATEAVEEHRIALALQPTADSILNLAVSLEAAGRSGEAIVQYQRFLNEWAEMNPDRAEMVRARIAALRAQPEPRLP